VLSVAGFYAQIGRFPDPGWFILRVKEACFLGAEAPLFDHPFITVITASNTTRMTVSRRAMTRVYRAGYTYRAWWEAYTAGWGTPPTYPGGHYAPHCSLFLPKT